MNYLFFISDDALFKSVKKVIDKIESAERNIESKLHKNVLDPFSALFDGITRSMSYTQWLESEKVRQLQKTMQNAIGDFHQDILGNVFGCENLGIGGGLDVCNRNKKFIAEIKNKFNTTKGDHKTAIYDSIENKLNTAEFKDFTGYYVEIIPKNKKVYNEPFVPSDNKTKQRRTINEKIRIIDGKSFYELATGSKTGLQDLFEFLPDFIAANFKYKFDKKETKKYMELFAMAFKVE